MLCPELGIAKAAIQALATETHMLHRAPRSAMRRKQPLQTQSCDIASRGFLLRCSPAGSAVRCGREVPGPVNLHNAGRMCRSHPCSLADSRVKSVACSFSREARRSFRWRSGCCPTLRDWNNRCARWVVCKSGCQESLPEPQANQPQAAQ